MITLAPASSRLALREFFHFPRQVYAKWPSHRSTDDEVVRLLVQGPTAFHAHASVTPFLLKNQRHTVGRCAIIHDRMRPEYVQVAFFEALPDQEGFQQALTLKASVLHPEASRLVVGLNGHLNYSAGFLASTFDKPPVFGLPYTPPYYLDYFQGMERLEMKSFRFEAEPFYSFHQKAAPKLDVGPIKVRAMDHRQLSREVDIYTYLNNICFKNHPYWAHRTSAEDFELFHPFRFLMKNNNLLIAEHDGWPVGFLLWYPDFNELTKHNQSLGLTHLLRYHLINPIKTVRFTEIGVHPEYRKRGVVPALMMKMIEVVKEGDYSFVEGGFVFDSNDQSLDMIFRYLSKAFGKALTPFRTYCIFEASL